MPPHSVSNASGERTRTNRTEAEWKKIVETTDTKISCIVLCSPSNTRPSTRTEHERGRPRVPTKLTEFETHHHFV